MKQHFEDGVHAGNVLGISKKTVAAASSTTVMALHYAAKLPKMFLGPETIYLCLIVSALVAVTIFFNHTWRFIADSKGKFAGAVILAASLFYFVYLTTGSLVEPAFLFSATVLAASMRKLNSFKTMGSDLGLK